MIERGISEQEIKKAVRAGTKYIQYRDKTVADYAYFSVVFKEREDYIFIITVKPRY